MSTDNHKFPAHFKEFIQSLNNHQVEYMLIGGYAMGAYGHIRATNDMDIYIHATIENANKMIAACLEYGINREKLKVEMFLIPKMIGIGEPPLRIEILKKLDVIDFSLAYPRKITREVDGVEINVIGLQDLGLLKEAAIQSRNEARDKEDLNYIAKLLNKLKD